MNKFTVQFLDDKKFEALSLVNPRYQNTKDDLGFADMVTNRIFVRRTGISFVDQFVTGHEIEEILARNSEHQDEFNIRHKKGGGIARIVLPIVAGLATGGIGTALGLGGTMASALGTTAGAATAGGMTGGKPAQWLPSAALGGLGGWGGAGIGARAVKGATAAAPGFLSKAAGMAKGALGFAPATAAPTTTTATPLTTAFKASEAAKFGTPVTFGGQQYGITGGVTKGLTAAALPATTGLGFQAPAPTSVTPTSVRDVVSRVQKMGAETTTGQGVTPPTQAPTVPKIGAASVLPLALAPSAPAPSETPKLDKWLGEGWRQTVLGASIPLIGMSMMGQRMFPEGSENVPFTPQQSQLFQETANMVRQGPQVKLSPAQQQAITANFDEAANRARKNLVRTYLETTKPELITRYKLARPGSSPEDDTQFMEDLKNVDRDFAELLSELETEFGTKRANALASAQLGLGAQQTQMMSELAAMDIYSLAMRAGISYQEAKDYKDMLGQIGFMVSQSGRPVYMR